MSDREFENYLTLLAGLLRLNGKQREAIADELRSHLEDRLEELIASGISRDQAIQQALAEFGDAAGLARQFGAISQNRKRWWLMRMTTFSVAAMLLLAASLAIFWPGRNAAPGMAIVEAQQAPQLAPPAGQPTAAKVASPGEPSLEEMLNQRIDVDFGNVPLKDAIAFIQDQTGIQFVIKERKLEEASLNPDVPVSKHLKRVRVKTLLELILEDLELSYVDRDGIILITTPENAESKLQIRVYDCRDLLAMVSPGAARPSSASAPSPAAIVTPPTLTPPTLRAGTGYLGATLDDADAQESGIRVISVKESAPAWAGGLRDGDLITSVNGKRLTNMLTFDMILARSTPGQSLSLGYEHNGEHGHTAVTLGSRPGATPVAAQKPSETPSDSAAPPAAAAPAAAAPAPPIAGGNNASGGVPAPGRRAMQPLSEYERRSNELIELITSIVKPDSWDDVGGPGAIDGYNGLIVVAQTAEVHQTVERLLDMLREAADLEVKTGKVVRQ